MTEVGVTVNVEVAHTDAAGRVHGHSYIIEVWYPEGADLVTLAAFTKDAASGIDHTMLEDSIGSPKMEAMACWFLTKLPTAIRVTVKRPTLGFLATATR